MISNNIAIITDSTCDIPQEAEILKNKILEEFTPVELITNMTGPVLGINTGPKAKALVG